MNSSKKILTKFKNLLAIFKPGQKTRALEKKIQELEYRSFNRRFYAVEQVTEYLVGAEIPGDYLEFGVYKGDTFIHAYRWLMPNFPKMRFFAFDSFEGLPKPKGLDKKDDFSSNFHKNEFACSKTDFLKNLRKEKIDLRKVRAIKGWFDETLKTKNLKKNSIDKIAFVWIDCDLYESTVPVLNFIISRLTPGMVIVFDDWGSFRNNPKLGEQRACREWLQRNPKIKLGELFSYGCCGKVFTVVSC